MSPEGIGMAYMAAASGLISDAVGKDASTEGGETTTSGKEDSSEFRGPISPGSLGSPIPNPHSNFRRTIPSQWGYFNSRYPEHLEVQIAL